MSEDPTFESYDFPACVTAADGNEEVFASIRFARFDPTSLDVRLHLLGAQAQRARVASDLTQLQWNYLWVFGAGAAKSTCVELLGLAGIGSTGTSDTTEYLSPFPDAVQINIHDEPLTTDGRYQVSAQLVPSGILIQPKLIRAHLDGTVEHKLLEDAEIAIATSEGRFLACERHESFSTTEFGNKVTHTVSRAVIEGELKVRAGESLYRVHERFRGVLSDLCAVLSFCYRVPVSYYEIRYFRVDEGVNFAERRSVLRRRTTPVTRPAGSDDLINYRDLRNGGLEKLYKSLIESPHRDTIQRVLGFLSGSHASGALEESYFLAYAALEATVTAATSPASRYNLGTAQFKKLSKQIKKVIEEFAAILHRPGVAGAVVDKLPELRRPSTTKRVTEVVQTLDVATNDLWLRLGFDAGLARATKNRNLLVHAARIHDPAELENDRIRLWILTERVILKLLGWPDDKIWRWYDQPLKWVNHSDVDPA